MIHLHTHCGEDDVSFIFVIATIEIIPFVLIV